MQRSRYRQHYQAYQQATNLQNRTPSQVRAEQAAALKMRRTDAQLILNSGVGQPQFVVQAMLVLSELTPTGVRVFAQRGFNREQQVTIHIPGLRNFFAHGKVVACKEVALNSSILTTRQVYRYWIDIDFDFKDEMERQAVSNYCQFLATA